jgi:hypothetical protein
MNPVVRVLEILLDATVCSSCVEIIGMLHAVEVEAALTRLVALLTAVVMSGVCDRCHHTSVVYQLNPSLVAPLAIRRRDPSFHDGMAADLVAVLNKEPLCLDCLSKRLTCPREDVASALNALRQTAGLSLRPALCASCLSTRITYMVT